MKSENAKSDRLNVHSFRWTFVQNLAGFSLRMSSARLPLPFVNPIKSLFRSNIVVVIVIVVTVDIARRSKRAGHAHTTLPHQRNPRKWQVAKSRVVVTLPKIKVNKTWRGRACVAYFFRASGMYTTTNCSIVNNARERAREFELLSGQARKYLQ